MLKYELEVTKFVTSSKEMTQDLILKIYSQTHSVFTLDELSLLFSDIPYSHLRRRLNYFTKIGKLKRLHQGIYAKAEYSPYELVNKLYKPSYISLQTVLVKGVIFQYYETIFAVSYLTREVTVGSLTIQYRRIKGSVLINTSGIERKGGYFMATLERAFLDAVFIHKDYHFDNLGALDWKKVFELVPIYHNKTFEKRVKSYYQDYREEERDYAQQGLA